AGQGVPRNAALAERMFSAAASLGNANSLLLIAMRFNTGTHGYPKDVVRALALAIVAGMYGADPQQVVKLAPPRSPADPAAVTRLVTQYHNEIEARTGNARRSPAEGMPPMPLTPG